MTKKIRKRKTYKKGSKKSLKKKKSKRRRTLNKKKLKGGTFHESPLIKSLQKTYQLLEYNKQMYNNEIFIETTLQDIYNLIRKEYNTNKLSFEDCKQGKCCINPMKGVVSSISNYEDCVKEIIYTSEGPKPINKWIGPISTTPYTFDKGYSNIPGLTIIPSVLSRLGEEHIFKIDQPLNIVIKNIINFYVQLLYYLEDTHEHILPSAYDSFLIDSKIHYIDVLLQHDLCDPDTIVLYYDLENDKEDISLRSEKTIQNIQKMQKLTDNKELNSFYIKTAFGGSTKCVINQKGLPALQMFQNPTDIYKHILPFYEHHGVDCIGKYYGVIIQPENLHFNLENSSHGEIRCFCHRGDIKCIITKTQGKNIVHGYPFWMISLHKSVLIKKKELYLKDLDNETFNQQLLSMNKNLTEFTTELNIMCDNIIDKLPELILSEPKDAEIYNSNIIDLCKSTYNIVKKNLEIDGIHHRIDIINSRYNKQEYVVNEIENINFGEMSNEIRKSGSVLMKYVNTIKEYRSYLDPENNTEEILQLKEDITKIIPLDYSFKSLTFDMKFSPPLYPDEFEEKLRKNGFGERGDKGFVDDVFKRIHEHFSSKGDKISNDIYRNFFLDIDLNKLTFDESNIEGLLKIHLKNIFNNWDEWDNRKILLSFD